MYKFVDRIVYWRAKQLFAEICIGKQKCFMVMIIVIVQKVFTEFCILVQNCLQSISWGLKMFLQNSALGNEIEFTK